MTLPEDYINRPVRSLQTMLQVLSNVFPALLTVNPDGIYGETTQKAVRAFQRFSGLPETGIAEQETWNSLASCYLRHAPSVLPPEPLRIVLQPGRKLAPGEQNLHLFLMRPGWPRSPGASPMPIPRRSRAFSTRQPKKQFWNCRRSSVTRRPA